MGGVRGKVSQRPSSSKGSSQLTVQIGRLTLTVRMSDILPLSKAAQPKAPAQVHTPRKKETRGVKQTTLNGGAAKAEVSSGAMCCQA